MHRLTTMRGVSSDSAEEECPADDVLDGVRGDDGDFSMPPRTRAAVGDVGSLPCSLSLFFLSLSSHSALGVEVQVDTLKPTA